ncbi:uncharacterized protein LOC128560786 [Nycticebus coucang]|uniref:uncharacterized protein LOC128560786 n=1 Tax=Nycticebus coucang TaxID=9470 RepID=UPI00234D3AF6|nr:uncharacterized protein LOC128560786 [Nycticebus coucang]
MHAREAATQNPDYFVYTCAQQENKRPVPLGLDIKQKFQWQWQWQHQPQEAQVLCRRLATMQQNGAVRQQQGLPSPTPANSQPPLKMSQPQPTSQSQPTPPNSMPLYLPRPQTAGPVSQGKAGDPSNPSSDYSATPSRIPTCSSRNGNPDSAGSQDKVSDSLGANISKASAIPNAPVSHDPYGYEPTSHGPRSKWAFGGRFGNHRDAATATLGPRRIASAPAITVWDAKASHNVSGPAWSALEHGSTTRTEPAYWKVFFGLVVTHSFQRSLYLPDFPDEEDGPEQVIRGKKQRKTKHRHRFTNEEMKKLKKIFTYNPYPDFTTREELAKKLQCQVNVIDNWFQNSRARLPTKERRRIFATWKQCNVPVQAHPLLEVQDTQAEAPNYTTNQSLSCAQKILMGRADCSSLEKQGIPSQQAGPSWSSPVSGTIKQPGGALENQDHTGSGRSPSCPFPSYSPAGCLHTSKALVCYFVKERVDNGESQHADPFLSCYLHSEYGVRKQQEEQEEDNFKKCSLSECLQQDDWQYYLEQHQRPQIYQEKMLFLEQLTMDLGPGDQGQDLDSSQLQLQVQFPQNNGEPGCSQLQQAPPQIVANSSLLSPGQHMRQWVSDQPRAQMQQPPLLPLEQHIHRGVSYQPRAEMQQPPLLSPGQRIQQGASYQPRAEMQQPPLLPPEQRMQQGTSYQPTAQMQQPPLLSPGQCMQQEISHQPRAEMQQPPLLSPGKRMQEEIAYRPRAEMQQPPLLPPEQRMQQGTSYQPTAQMQQPPLLSPGQCMQQEIAYQPRAEMQQPPLLPPEQRMQQGTSYQPRAQMRQPPLLPPGQLMQQGASYQPTAQMQQPPLLPPGQHMQQRASYQPRAQMQQPPLLPPGQHMQQGNSYQPRAQMQQPPLLPPWQYM